MKFNKIHFIASRQGGSRWHQTCCGILVDPKNTTAHSHELVTCKNCKRVMYPSEKELVREDRKRKK